MKLFKRSAWIQAGLFVFALATLVVGSASAGSAMSATNSVTFQDSTGENAAAPDISTVVVSNDNTGLVSFQITLANRPTLGPTEIVFVYIDSDNNLSTGYPPIGIDYLAQYYKGRITLWRWDTGKQDFVIAPMTTLRSDWSSTKLTVYVNTSEIGGPSTFSFAVETGANPDDPNEAYDLAPSFLPFWQYEVKLAPAVTVGAITVAPQPVVPGKTMTAKATVSVTRGGKPEALASNAVVEWKATLGDQTLKQTGAQVGADGVLTATWLVPAGTTAKSVHVSLSVTMEDVNATQAADVKVQYVAPVLRITTLDCTPEPAKAGMPMTGKAVVLMTRGGVKQALPANARATWTATVDGKTLRPIGTKLAPNGVVLSKWKLPKVVNAKTVRIVLTVKAEGVTVTKTHMHRVK